MLTLTIANCGGEVPRLHFGATRIRRSFIDFYRFAGLQLASGNRRLQEWRFHNTFPIMGQIAAEFPGFSAARPSSRVNDAHLAASKNVSGIA